MVQLARRKADLEAEIDSKLSELRDGHEQQLQQLARQHDIRKQKLNDDHQQRVSVVFHTFQQMMPLCHSTVWHFIEFEHF